jgi:hypothetical protein
MRALGLVALLLLAPTAALADSREGWYIGAPNGIFAPPPTPRGQERPHFYIGGPNGTFAPPAPSYPTAVPYCVPRGYWAYALVSDGMGGTYYQPYWVSLGC